jgi:23S rRNA (pseudouridine1915-N3)-methyltransferase
MNIHLIAVGKRPPEWVDSGFQDYAKRLSGPCRLILKEINPGNRSKGADVRRAIEDEGRRMLAAIPEQATVIALDENGRSWSSEKLSEQLQDWMQTGHDVALLVGGPDGLHPDCKQRASVIWSLSALTLPHAMVRILVTEQIYRAWSILNNHPYHRQ